MKIRNKKTGEIKNVNHNNVLIHFNDGQTKCVHSLAELNEEWEDYEEPTGYWYIDFDGEVLGCVERFDEETEEQRKEIGNYFETKEEAEKAVEKLKAWKRLKDGGFKFKDFARLNDQAYIIRATSNESWTNLYDDLELLFGGNQ